MTRCRVSRDREPRRDDARMVLALALGAIGCVMFGAAIAAIEQAGWFALIGRALTGVAR